MKNLRYSWPAQKVPVYPAAHAHCALPLLSTEHVPPFLQGWFNWHTTNARLLLAECREILVHFLINDTESVLSKNTLFSKLYFFS